MVHVVLVKGNLLRRVVTLWPLRQAPLLHDALVRLEGDVLAGDVAVEYGEAATDVRAVELARCAPRERRNALRVGESDVQLLGRCAEFVLRGDRCGVHGHLLAAGGSGGRGGRLRRARLARVGGCLLRLLRVLVRGRESAGRVRVGSMLDVLGVLRDQRRSQLPELLAQLRSDL